MAGASRSAPRSGWSSPRGTTCCSTGRPGRGTGRADEVWYVEADAGVRLERLLARHVEFGKSPAEARAWVAAVDEPNARLVERCRDGADLVVRL